MRRLPILGLMLLLTVAAPAAVGLETYGFTFSGAAYDGNGALVRGSITIDNALLANPGLNVYDPTGRLGGLYGAPTANLVTALTLVVTGSTNGTGDGTFTLSDYDAVVFGISVSPLDLTQELVGQAIAGLTGKTWGQNDPIPGSNPLLAYTGDFQLFAKSASPAAPTGISPFQLGTNGGNDDGLQLTSFRVPEPSTYLLLTLGLGLAGFARVRMG